MEISTKYLKFYHGGGDSMGVSFHVLRITIPFTGGTTLRVYRVRDNDTGAIGWQAGRWLA